MSILKWDQFDDKMKSRAAEELLRFMTLFASSAALVCFFAALTSDGDMRIPLVLLTFMVIFTVSWQWVRRKNVKRWGEAKRQGKELFRIGMTQPGKDEATRKDAGNTVQSKKKKKSNKKKGYK